VQSVGPIAVESSTLLPGDLSFSFTGGQNTVVVTYNGSAKSFAIGDSLSVKVALIASPHPGPGKLSLSSQFISTVNGAPPFTTASIVDFANSGTSAVTHDQSLTGDGTQPTPLGIAPGGVVAPDLAAGAVTNPAIAVGAVTASKIAAGQVVKSLNGLSDAVSLGAGAGISITPTGNTLTFATSGLLASVSHDGTLAGNGTSGSPLGVASQGIGAAQLAAGAVTTPQLADNSVTSAKIAAAQVGTTQLANNAVTTAQLAPDSVTAAKVPPGQLVKSLNGITDNVTISPGLNVGITTNGSLMTISVPNALTSIAHDVSLSGNGTSASPLTVVAPTTPTPQPVFFTDSLTANSASSPTIAFGAATYTVPQGQRLVIQQVMATVENSDFSANCSAFLLIDALPLGPNGVPGGNTLPIVVTQQAGYTGPFSEANAFGGSQQVTIFLNAGEVVQFGGACTGTNLSLFRWYLYGYLVPAP
jgi:hypothetical protein